MLTEPENHRGIPSFAPGPKNVGGTPLFPLRHSFHIRERQGGAAGVRPNAGMTSGGRSNGK
jgi:hypothetical protein